MSRIVQYFSEHVAKTEAIVLDQLKKADPKITGIQYQHGHYDEVETTLRQFEESKNFYNKKYPLVVLFEDIPQRTVNGVTEARATILICYTSDKEYKSEDRYQNIINPILQPIYDELINQILASGYYYGYKVNHEPIVRPFAGLSAERGNKGALFSDILDAIEMRNTVLKLYPVCECK